MEWLIASSHSVIRRLFDASSSIPVVTRSTKLLHNIGIEEGMANVGDKKDSFRVDKTLFKTTEASILIVMKN